VPPGKLGFCHNKKNVEGTYYSLVYNRPAVLQVDPIEKEPAFHMLPGATIYCTGTASCNNRCRFCHNWELSQQTLWHVVNLGASVDEVVAQAQANGCQAVSFTYNEPTVFYEYMHDIAARAREAGMGALFHTNGGMNREPMLALLEVMDAVTVDLKGFTDEFYRRVSSSSLAPVLRTLETVRKAGAHLEIVNLVIPTLNDDLEDIRRMCAWIVSHLGADVPLHFIRFFPTYKLQRLPLTPIETLEAAAGAADAEGLQYVYIGNCPGHERNSTFCPGCGHKVIERVHFAVLSLKLDHVRCPSCGHEIPGIWRNA
jgi:pyruvate formate lyase activating enzyme